MPALCPSLLDELILILQNPEHKWSLVSKCHWKLSSGCDRDSVPLSSPAFLITLLRQTGAWKSWAHNSQLLRFLGLCLLFTLNLQHLRHCFLRASLVAQRLSVCLQCGRPGFDPWVGKTLWRMAWLPTAVFLPGEFHGQRSLVSSRPGSCRVRHDWD